MKLIAIIGLGYVGLPLAVEFGKSRSVIGYDINQERVEQLRQGVDLTNECDHLQLKSASHLRYTSSIDDLEEAKIYIITVPTPIDHVNRPDLTALISATKTVGSVLKLGDLVIFESTVYPGATEEICIPILEEQSGLMFNSDFFCGYSPERINPGDKINTLKTIKKITSGSNAVAARDVDDLYSSIITAGTVSVSSIRVAEAAKVIENSQRDLNIAFINELSVIFDKLEIDTAEVLEAAGTKWNFLPFKPGLVGGHCIGVDPYYLTYKAQEIGYIPQVLLAGRKINDGMAQYAAQSVIKRMVKSGCNISGSSVGVFGITFKDNCPDTRNSKVVDLIQELESWHINVRVVDPWADPVIVKRDYGINLVDVSSLGDLSAVIVAVAHDEFRSIRIDEFRSLCHESRPVFGDLKSVYDKKSLTNAGFSVFRL